jgi:2-polyprenyl-3-methyl-5-hydroxy-6-metoxy-1,4-benzoquinol methylase
VSAPYVNRDDHSASVAATSRYLLGPLLRLAGPLRPGTRVLDAGCGNGFYAAQFLARGCVVVGVDLGEAGIAHARKTYPQGRFELAEVDPTLLPRLGEDPFDLVISTEVIEHLYQPKAFVAGCFAALKPGGRFVCTTPYHGYLKNLALAATNKFDLHVNPLQDGGHIKFWSRRTLSVLLTQAGFRKIRFAGAGRVPGLWKSMVMAGERP